MCSCRSPISSSERSSPRCPPPRPRPRPRAAWHAGTAASAGACARSAEARGGWAGVTGDGGPSAGGAGLASLPRSPSRFASWPAFVGLALASHLARLLLAYVPSTWLWGLSAQRYLSPAIGWTTWSAALVCLLALWKAPLGAAAARERGAGALPRVRLAALFSAIAGALVWSLRDETYFIGDFIMRAGAVSRGSLAASFPQSMPGDVWVHQLLPAGLQAALGVPLGASARLLGALEAAAL